MKLASAIKALETGLMYTYSVTELYVQLSSPKFTPLLKVHEDSSQNKFTQSWWTSRGSNPCANGLTAINRHHKDRKTQERFQTANRAS